MAIISIIDLPSPCDHRARELGKGVLIKKGLGSGALAGGAARSVEESFRPIFALDGVSSLIVGTLSREHLRENAQAAARITAK